MSINLSNYQDNRVLFAEVMKPLMLSALFVFCLLHPVSANQNELLISGHIFEDTNSDGVRNLGERGLSDEELNLISPDGNIKTEMTDKEGYYQFADLTAGSYHLKVSAQEEWIATVPAEGSRRIELQDSNDEDVDFGFKSSSNLALDGQVGSNQPSVRTEKISGAGSIKKDYYIQNNANDSAKVSVEIKNANYYEYTYSIYSDEVQSTADLDLVVEDAESITCSGDAKNRNNIPANITTIIKNGNLIYNNSVVSSNKDVQTSQNIITNTSDSIDAIGKAGRDNLLENTITTRHSESFQSTQKLSIGQETSTFAQINATTGPLKVSSYIGKGDSWLNTTADVTAGVVSIDQQITPFEAHQDSKGVTGGANFDTLIKIANGDKTHVYTSVGSGNLINLSQNASGQNTDYAMEYEYMPISYSTGTYDVGFMEGGSDITSDKNLVNKIISKYCEQMKIIHTANLNENPLINTSLNAITGPLKVASYIVEGDRKLNTTADVAAGIVSITQVMNITNALQNSKGVIGGATFDTWTTNVDGKNKSAYTEVGSGNLNSLYHLASWMNALYKVGYEYMPVSYQTGTYDLNLNSSKIEGN